MLNPGETIEYLEDVSSPPQQQGRRGQTKVIDQDIPLWTAKYLMRGHKVRLYDPKAPLVIKKEKAREPKPAAGEEITNIRGTEKNGRKRKVTEGNQKSDIGTKKPSADRKKKICRR